MVNSVRMLNSFDEVRYIYEAEGILFNYFRKNYKSQKPGTETIMVYDMGGATINLSIFRVDYTEENGTIYYNVHTLGRIGYAVGGDNIDVAIMEHIFTLPQLTTSLTEKEQEQNHRLAEDLKKTEA
jgi:Molecular chaperone